ncbi:hypothetical protein VNI00_014730 [Paramarasmius palmivorus]|uniref:Uncharacterized protein n=1 Tax=Paramarasmius palmivorus TaxID=297713 RepID=A0AAW0BQI6_9AGAR
MQRYKIVVTTYGVVKAEHQMFQEDNGLRTHKFRDALFRTFWRRVALDEAHMIRNRSTKCSQACCDLPATFRWCITATPLQNEVTDFYALFRFLQVQPFSDYKWFKNTIEVPLKLARPSKTNKAAAIKALTTLRAGLGHVLIRRRKDDYIDGVRVLDLPDYELYLITCKLPPDERVLYDTLQNKFTTLITKLNLSTQYILVLLLRLRQACLHGKLLLETIWSDWSDINETVPDSDAETDWDDDDSPRQPGCFKCKSPLSTANEDEARAHREACKLVTQLHYNQPISQRVTAVEAILTEIPCGEKVIVFSSFVTMLDVIHSYIGDKFHCVHYNGGMKTLEREKSLKAIREDPNVKVLLMSLKAGGIGLNLADCNHIILVDLWWNPAVEVDSTLYSRVDDNSSFTGTSYWEGA